MTCLGEVVKHFPHAVGYLFVRETFSKEGKRDVQNMVQSLKDAFQRNLDDLQWMDAESKVAAIRKLKAMRFKVGYPDYYDNDNERFTELHDFYVNRNDYYGNVEKSIKSKVRQSINRLRLPYREDEWQESPQGTRAYYSLQTNEIVFPAGILQNPLYSISNPPAVNFGALGSILGHEIIHAFDQVGAGYNDNGVKDIWWSTDTKNAFNRESQCIIDSYVSYLNQTRQTRVTKLSYPLSYKA